LQLATSFELPGAGSAGVELPTFLWSTNTMSDYVPGAISTLWHP